MKWITIVLLIAAVGCATAGLCTPEARATLDRFKVGLQLADDVVALACEVVESLDCKDAEATAEKWAKRLELAERAFNQLCPDEAMPTLTMGTPLSDQKALEILNELNAWAGSQ